jgi:hypothetical protein
MNNKTVETIEGELLRVRILEKCDKLLEIQLGLGTKPGDFFKDSGNSFDAYWIQDLQQVLCKTRQYLETNCERTGYENRQYKIKE